jgi:hypothetical protein
LIKKEIKSEIDGAVFYPEKYLSIIYSALNNLLITSHFSLETLSCNPDFKL